MFVEAKALRILHVRVNKLELGFVLARCLYLQTPSCPYLILLLPKTVCFVPYLAIPSNYLASPGRKNINYTMLLGE